jgi:hypothetical protein
MTTLKELKYILTDHIISVAPDHIYTNELLTHAVTLAYIKRDIEKIIDKEITKTVDCSDIYEILSGL